eukprot:403365065
METNSIKCLFLGLDSTGKTTHLYNIKLNECLSTINTIGFNVENINRNGNEFQIWDVGGLEKIRLLWRHYFMDTKAVFFFIDQSDTERYQVAAEEIRILVQEPEFSEAKFIILISKCDKTMIHSKEEIIDRLELMKLLETKDNFIQEIDQLGRGKFEPFDWLSSMLSNGGSAAPPREDLNMIGYY